MGPIADSVTDNPQNSMYFNSASNLQVLLSGIQYTELQIEGWGQTWQKICSFFLKELHRDDKRPVMFKMT